MLLKLNNAAAVPYINKKGETILASCNKLVKDIWNWAMEQNIWISAAHVSTWGFKTFLVISGHRFFPITKSGV